MKSATQIFNFANCREKLSLNRNWRFYDGDFPAPTENYEIRYRDNMYGACRSGVKSPNFSDQHWETINVPHDFVLRHARNPEITQYYGFRPRGVGWYRKSFSLDESDKGKSIELIFESVVSACELYFNGANVQSNRCGYTSFKCDVTPLARYGDDTNTIVVRADATVCEGWWYEGGGINRDVWLVKRPPCFFETDGLWADPVFHDNAWHIPAEATIGNTLSESVILQFQLEISDNCGNIIACGSSTPTEVKPFIANTLKYDLKIAQEIKLWSPADPQLYNVTAKLCTPEGDVIDTICQRCGFRTIKFDAQKGFFLNGERLQIRGTCNHQDYMGTGVAIPKSLERFKLLKLKSMGSNAYRTAHHPPTAALLDMCDELGIMVMDENRHFGISEEVRRQLEWLIKRDRNHPSIIMWSLCNEEPLQGSYTGEQIARRMNAIVKNLDPTRFTICPMNGGLFNEYNSANACDVAGFNYSIERYDNYHKLHPDKPVMSSEDSSAIVTRGEPFSSTEKHLFADNDTEIVPWGATHNVAETAVASRPWMAGAFVWAGFDYHGEPTPVKWPSNSTFFGLIDMCGFPKTGYYVRKAHWLSNDSLLYITPHWNLDVAQNTIIDVCVVSNAFKVELFINNKSYGTQDVTVEKVNRFKVPYIPGEIKAVSYDKSGNKILETSHVTTSEPVAIKLVPAMFDTVDNDNYDTIPINVYVVDKCDRIVPNADNLINFSVNDNGVICGVGNGNQNSLEDELGKSRMLYNGYAQVLIRAKEDSSGVVELTASGENLLSATYSIPIKKPEKEVIYIPSKDGFYPCDEWKHSPLTTEKPDPTIHIAEDDVNSWEPGGIGEKYSVAQGKYMMFRTDISSIAGTNKLLMFNSVTGIATIFVDGKQLGKGVSLVDERCLLTFESGKELTMLLEANDQEYIGITGPVFFQQ